MDQQKQSFFIQEYKKIRSDNQVKSVSLVLNKPTWQLFLLKVKPFCVAKGNLQRNR